MTPAAPLEKAVEKLRDDLKYVNASRVETDHGSDVADVIRSADALLAALDADKSLEKAETALREIADGAGFSYASQGAAIRMVDIARGYFARREEKGEPNAR